jgi:hypothetical protein
MTGKIPKGKTPSLIGSSNGRPKRIDVARKSVCSRCKDDISIGAECFNIPKSGNGFVTEKRFCKSCYDKVIEQTQKDLEELKIL